MHAPLNGYIKTIYVHEGQDVKQGAKLLTIENLDLEQKFQLAQVNKTQAKLNVAYTQQLLKNEHQRLTIYKKIGHDRVVSASAMSSISQKTLLTEKHKLERLSELLKNKYISQAVWEKQEALYKNAQEQVKRAEAMERLQDQALKATDKGLYFTGSKTEGMESDLRAQLDIAEHQVHLHERRTNIYKKLINKLTLRAPFDAKVTQLLKSTGNTTDNKTPVILIENTSAAKTITAYLTQHEVIHIKAASKVSIYIPATGTSYRGKIIEINRTQGFVDEVNAQYRWRDFQTDRSAKVTVSLDERDQKAFNQHAFAGMPAIVYFKKQHHWF
jgi:multidrug efflux pump subunit AcrA (membrane-fusion protein)